MNKSLFILVLLLLAVTCVFALPVTSDTAKRVAGNFVTERLGSSYSVSNVSQIVSGYDQSYIYAVNLNPKGFVLVAANDSATPIIGYGTETKWGEGEIPSQLQYMLTIWNDQMNAIVTQRMSSTLEINQAWNKYNVSASSFVPTRDYRDVSPLITSVWGQGTYYNTQCPSGTPVGCVATAMSQIMRYWAFPAIGAGTHTYTYNGITHNVDYGATTYNWAGMPNNVTSSNTAVATICYQAGVSVNMQYAPSGSGAYSEDVPEALISHFRYDSSAHYYDKSSYTTGVWDGMMKGELDNSRPIYYSGSGPAGGHAWILDGYSGSYYHVNWGWNGSYNGNYTLTALNPGGDTFNSGQGAVIGIKPTVLSAALSEGFEGALFPPTGWTVTASTFARSATGYITGAYSARYNPTATGANCSGKQLRTPKLTVNGSSAPITFKAKRGTLNRTEQIKVGYSASATGPYTYLSTFTLTATATTFTQAVTAITPGEYYFVFETLSSTSTNNAKLWVLDDITGPDLPATPSLNMTTWAAGNLIPGDQARSGDVFTLTNTGGGTLTVSGVTNLSSTEFGTNFSSSIALVFGQSHTFGFTYDPLNIGSDAVNFVITTNAGAVTIALSGSAQNQIFGEGFEGATFPPTGWTNTDADGDGIKWFQYSAAGSAHTGTYSAASASYDTAIRTPNNWLITPQISLPAGNSTLNWWASAQDPDWVGEKYGVFISTTNTAPASFTQLFVETMTDAVWHSRSQSLSAYAGQNVYLAFRHFECTDMFYLKIDDVSVTTEGGGGPLYFGNLSGYVYASGTTEPISNALVTVGTKTTYTNASGFYQINNLLVGTVTAACEAPGMNYHAQTISGISITDGNTTSQNFGLTWGELAANPSSVSVNLYQGETGNSSITLSNPLGTANTAYAGYIITGSAPASRDQRNERLDIQVVKPETQTIHRDPTEVNVSDQDRLTGWYGYGDEATATVIISNNIVERGDYFAIDDIGLMDGAVTVSQLRHYFYNPASAPWTSTTNKFKWKVYSVSPTGTVSLVHTSSEITLPTTTPTNTTLLSSYTIPSPLTIPAGYDFIVTVLTTSSTGVPHSLITEVTYNNGIYLSGTTWTWMGYDAVMEAYVSGTHWLDGSSFSGTITPGGSVNIPLNFNTVGVSAGTKYANMYVYNDANYIAPNPRGDAMVIPISLTVTIPTTPIPVLNTNTWTTSANVGSPSNSGSVYTITNVGTNGLNITSITGLSGTPFTTSLTPVSGLAQNASVSFSFTFTPTTGGIFNATCSIETNYGTKTVTLRGYGNYIAESFEGTFPPDGWTTSDVDADTYNWMQYTATNAAHTGSMCAGSESYVNDSRDAKRHSSTRLVLTPNNWLITPRLTIVTGDELSYWIAAQDADWPAEHYSVKVSTTNNQIASFTNTLYSETLSSATWLNRTLSLSAYAGMNIFIAFQHHECTDQFVLKLDDILMPGLAAPLVYGNISGVVYKYGTTTPIVGATVSVAGRNTTSDENGAYTISNIVSDTYTLAATATGYIDYSTSVIIPENSTLNQSIYMSYANVYTADTNFSTNLNVGGSTSMNVQMTNTGNATLSFETASGVWGGDAFPSGAFLENFEDNDITGWVGSVGAYSDIYGSVAQPYGYNSNNTWVFASNQTTVTQWIATPKIRVQTGDNLSFWYKQFNASSETFSVLVSTTTNEYASFSTLATIGPLADTNWAQFNQSLDAYAGSDIYIGFYYPRTDAYEFGYVMLDDIAGGIGIMPPTGWLSCTPVGFPVAETLGAGLSRMLTLNIDAAGLAVGTYTAQTWVFSNGLVSPYKLYVTLTVQAASAPDAPIVSSIEVIPGGVGISWDEVANAVLYRVYGCAEPNGTYALVGNTTGTYHEVTDEILTNQGLNDKAFFYVTADSESRVASRAPVLSKTSSPLLQNYIRSDKTRKLNVMPW